MGFQPMRDVAGIVEMAGTPTRLIIDSASNIVKQRGRSIPRSSKPQLIQVLLDFRHQPLFWLVTHQPLHWQSVFKQDECWDAHHTIFHGGLPIRFDIQLTNSDFAVVLLRNLLDDGSYHFAGWAPS